MRQIKEAERAPIPAAGPTEVSGISKGRSGPFWYNARLIQPPSKFAKEACALVAITTEKSYSNDWRQINPDLAIASGAALLRRCFRPRSG